MKKSLGRREGGRERLRERESVNTLSLHDIEVRIPLSFAQILTKFWIKPRPEVGRGTKYLLNKSNVAMLH